MDETVKNNSMENENNSISQEKLIEARSENTRMKLELDCKKEVIEKIQNLVFTEEKLLNEKLQTLWSKTIQFFEESSKFHEEFGISSPWWNGQIMSLSNPQYQSAGCERKNKQNLLQLLQLESEKLAQDVKKQSEEINKLKNKIAADDAEIIVLRRMEENLQQEPFSTDFLYLKANLQRSKETCQQLEIVIATRKTVQESGIRKRGPELRKGEWCQPQLMGNKILCSRERTTFVFKTAYATRNSVNENQDTLPNKAIDQLQPFDYK